MPAPDNIRLILTIAACAMALMVVFRPVFGVSAYLIIMVTRPGLFYPLLGQLRVELLTGIAMLCYMVFTGRMPRLTFIDPINKKMFMLFGVMLLSMVQAIDLSYSWDWMFDFAKVLAFYMMIVTMLESESDVKFFLWVFGIMTAMLAYNAVYNFHSGIIHRAATGGNVDYAMTDDGMGAGHVALANLSLQGMPVILFLTLASKKDVMRIFGSLLLLICAYGVIVSGSRGGFVGLVAFYLCLLWVFKNRRGALIIVGILGAMLIPAVSPGGYLAYMDSILGLFSGTAGLSASSRTLGLEHGIEMLLKRPILGVGPGCYPIARRMWFAWGLWAHNHYGELMGDLGIIGSVMWFSFFLCYFKKAKQIWLSDSAADSVKLICAGILVANVVRLIVGYGSHSVYIFFWYMTAAVVVVMTRLIEGAEDRATAPRKSRQAVAKLEKKLK